jgi:hypothetical protein
MRKIKILTKGPIRPMNNCHGPILTPWEVSEERVRVFLKAGLDVVEVMPNGTEKKLTLTDVMVNGEDAPAEKPVEPPKAEAPVDDAPAAEVKYEEPVEEAVEETEDVAEDVAPEKPRYNNNHKKK